MKKMTLILLVVIIAFSVISCSKKNLPSINSVADMEGQILGTNSTSASKEILNPIIEKSLGVKLKEILYYPRSSDVVTALKAGKVDASLEIKFVADYYIKRNNDLKIINVTEDADGSVIMIVRNENQSLRDSLDLALATLQENGTLAALADKWITNLPASNEPVSEKIPVIEGAKTYYVGVTGNYTPLDYIAADGKPAGFNVALMSELSKMLNINIEFVPLEAQAKFPSLYSKKIDIIFSQFYTQQIASLINSSNDKFVFTKPYYSFEGLILLVRK